MVKYLFKRLALFAFIFVIIFTICFVLIRLLPLTPIDSLESTQQAAIRLRREAMGIGNGTPMYTQWWWFVKSIVTDWDWGVSESVQRMIPVTDILAERLPATIYVNVLSILISVPIGLLLGIYAALKKNTWIDHIISTGVMIFISVPSFVYAFLVQYLLYFKLGIIDTPIMKDGTDYFSWDMLKSVIMPVLSLAFGTIAGYTRVTRAELTEVLTGEYMLLARTKGLTKSQAIMKHGMKNTMIVILPAIFGTIIGVLSGSIIIESVFSVPGIGRLYMTSIGVRDYNLFMILTSFYTAIGLLANIIVDISYGFIDPRIRMGSKK